MLSRLADRVSMSQTLVIILRNTSQIDASWFEVHYYVDAVNLSYMVYRTSLVESVLTFTV